jgi:hypothetical protein
VEVIGKPRNIGLLPIAESHLNHTYGFVPRATQTVLFVSSNPYLLTRLTGLLGFADLDHSAVIDDDPQLGAAGMGLEAQPLPRQNGHQADRARLIMSVLFKRTPWTLH